MVFVRMTNNLIYFEDLLEINTTAGINRRQTIQMREHHLDEKKDTLGD